MSAFKINANAPSVYTEQLRIRSYHTDIHCRLTIPKLCSFFQELAGNQTNACGVGWDLMKQFDMFWVLSKLKIQVTEMPLWQQLVTIRTWSNGLDGIQAIRHFQVTDERGNELVRAISSWIMVNVQTRRIIRADEYMKDFPFHEERLFDTNPQKIELNEKPLFTAASPVQFTETDMNLHMNNVCYIERILNTFDFEYLKQHQIKQFEINFQKEALYGNLIKAGKVELGNDHFVGLIASDDEKAEFARINMHFIKK